jgi:HSP20 family protein
MSALTKYEPLRELETFARRLNGMFHSPFANDDFFSTAPMVLGNVFGQHFIPKVDITEDDKNMYIHAELPGMEKADVKVTVSDDGILTIKGEKKKEEKKETKNYVRMETNYGSFTRSFTLPPNVKSDAIDGNFEKGILNLTLPKTEVKKPAEQEVAIK